MEGYLQAFSHIPEARRVAGPVIVFRRAKAMIKKLIVSVVAVTLVAGVLLGSNAMSYLTTSCERVTETVENKIPLEFQIDRARKMVRDLEPEVPSLDACDRKRRGRS